MAARIGSVAFHGVDPRRVDVQCQLSAGSPGMAIVGLPDKAVAESKERVRAAFGSMGLAMPPKRAVINLSPADMPKEGAHFDLPIALALLAEMEVLPRSEVVRMAAMGELALDGRLVRVNGALPAAIAAAEDGLAFACPEECGPEAALVTAADVVAPSTLPALINHVTGRAPLGAPDPARPGPDDPLKDMRDVRGQEKARRALEIAAAGGHNMLMIGPPGVGKSMLAERLPGILPPLEAQEALEVSMIHSVAGEFPAGRLITRRPFRRPHHTASVAAMVGGGRLAAPGEVCMGHRGVLFLDEIAEFGRPVLESLRQPLESGETVIARANAHVRYPSRVQLVAAMNPCRCGYLADPGRACSRAPKCGLDYQGRLSGPLMDRIDLHVETPSIRPAELARLPEGETSAAVASRVAAARMRQRVRYGRADVLNAHVDGRALEQAAVMSPEARDLFLRAVEKLNLSARGMTRVLRLARTIADLEGEEILQRMHVAEAAGYRNALLPG